MLVLSRRPNEKILLPAANVTVEVVSIKHGTVRLGIAAPRDVAVWREELWNKAGQPQASLAAADQSGPEAAMRDLRHLVRNRLNVAAIGLALLRRQLDAALDASMLLLNQGSTHPRRCRATALQAIRKGTSWIIQACFTGS